MAKLTLSDLSNLQNEQSAVATINNNNAAIETALENTLSRDGTSPNTMGADLDMNSNNILNLPYPASENEPVRLGDIEDLIPSIYTQASAPSTSVASGSLWIDTDSTNQDLYQLVSGVWADTGANIKGDVGASGTDGVEGPAGPPNTLTIGTVTSGTADASITGTAPNQVLNLVLQEGPEGAPGSSINVYVQASAPSTAGVPEGSLWIDSDDNSSLYKLTSGSWVDQGVDLKGADGAGTGDFSSNTATSVDSEIVLFSGTGGKTGKRATGSGIAKITSGVLSTATSGTDYAPATSGSAILKGNGAGGFSNAVASTDYAPATSGSAILKGSGSGGFSNAAAGTDYVAPGGALGTPSSGTLTNCTGLPVAGITASTSTALGVGSLEIGHATANTLTASGGVLSIEGKTVATLSTAQAWTANQGYAETALSYTASGTTSWDVSTAPVATLACATGNTTMGAPTNVTSGSIYKIRIVQDTSARTIAWNAAYKFIGGSAPTISTGSGAIDHIVFYGRSGNVLEEIGRAQALA